MAEMIIQLRTNPQTGKKDIVIHLESDSDSLPHEHEQMHRKLVEKLIAGGLLGCGEAGELVVERLEEDQTPVDLGSKQGAPQRQSLSEG